MAQMVGPAEPRRSEALLLGIIKRKKLERNGRGQDRRLQISGRGVPSVEESMVSFT